MNYILNLLITAAFIFSILLGNAQYDETTINKVRVKFETAKTYYSSKKYSSALEKINEIEELMDGDRIASSQMLKVKILADQKKFTIAKEELEILEGLELNDDIIKELAVYSEKIDKGVKKEKALAEAYKHFKVEDCSNSSCKKGSIWEKKWKKCSHCGGTGKTRVGFSNNFQTCIMSACKGKGGSYRNMRRDCTSCQGKGNKYTYTGTYPFTQSEIEEYIRNNKSKIDSYHNSKQ